MIRAAKYDDRRPVLNGNSPTRTLGWSKNLSLPSLSTPSYPVYHRYLSCIASSSSHPFSRKKSAFLKRFVEDERITGRALFVISCRCKNPRNSSTPSPKWNFAGENLIYDRRNTLLPRLSSSFLSAIVKYSISEEGGDISRKGSKRLDFKSPLPDVFSNDILIWCDIRFGLLILPIRIYLFIKNYITLELWFLTCTRYRRI